MADEKATHPAAAAAAASRWRGSLSELMGDEPAHSIETTTTPSLEIYGAVRSGAFPKSPPDLVFLLSSRIRCRCQQDAPCPFSCLAPPPRALNHTRRCCTTNLHPHLRAAASVHCPDTTPTSVILRAPVSLLLWSNRPAILVATCRRILVTWLGIETFCDTPPSFNGGPNKKLASAL